MHRRCLPLCSSHDWTAQCFFCNGSVCIPDSLNEPDEKSLAIFVTLEEFKDFLDRGGPPPGLAPLLLSLWNDAQGNWDAAHRVVQSDQSAEGAWVHAYLHRKEGDLSNASYWYSRSSRAMPSSSSEEEWESIVRTLLDLSKITSSSPKEGK